LEKLFTFIVFQQDISGNSNNLEQSANNLQKLVILKVSHFDISGRDFIEQHPHNAPFI
jgi:DNA-binding ferritin-like protein